MGIIQLYIILTDSSTKWRPSLAEVTYLGHALRMLRGMSFVLL